MANKRLKRLNKFLGKREQIRRQLSEAATSVGLNTARHATRRAIREHAHRLVEQAVPHVE